MPERRPAVYSHAHIERCKDWLATGDARWSLFFARNEIAPLVVTYEDLCADPQSVISAIGRHVGAPGATIGAEICGPRVQRSARNDEWRDRFIAESKDLGVLPALKGVTFAEHLWRREDECAADEPAPPMFATERG